MVSSDFLSYMSLRVPCIGNAKRGLSRDCTNVTLCTYTQGVIRVFGGGGRCSVLTLVRLISST